MTNERAWSFAPGLAVRYTFHFQIAKKFGGVVGTDVQSSYEWMDLGRRNLSSYCSRGGFRPGVSLYMPSILLGVVQNYVADQRFLLLASYSAAWFPAMKTCVDGVARDYKLSAIPHAFALLSGLDLFASTSTAWTVQLGYRLNYVQCVGRAENCNHNTGGQGVLEGLRFMAHGPVMQLGFTWQPGDEIPLLR